MSEVDKTKTHRRKFVILKRIGKVILTLYVIVCLLELLLLGYSVESDFSFHLALGWGFYLYGVVPKTQLNLELLLTSLSALVIAAAGLQLFISRVFAKGRWPWLWTLMWCGLLIVMFGTSIAAVGIVHQVGWLFRMPSWIEMRGMSTQMKAVNNAKQVLLAALQHARDHEGRLPDTCAEMMPEIVHDSRIFWASADRNMPVEPLVYAGAGMHDTDDGNLPVVWTPRPSADGKRVVTRLDGSSQVVTEEEFQTMLAARRVFFARREADAKTPR